jgi:ABC-type sugar transport system ATPase subunit
MLVELQNLSKRFGGVQALRDVSLKLESGEVHALCGENGAGKSTLIKILCGIVRPDTGAVVVDGSPLPPGMVRASEKAGIAVIHQESAAFPDLDAVDNLFIGRELRTRFGSLDRREMERRTRSLLARLGEDFDPRVPLSRRTVAQRQMVALARALSQDCRLLIMDEPTAALSRRETETLFRIVRQLRTDGVGILYVSHRMEEIYLLADRISVLRDGRHVGTETPEALPRPQLIQRMVGREVTERDRPPSSHTPGAQVLRVHGLGGHGFQNISFEVHAGEIVGLAGLVGAGRSEVARAIFGVDPLASGTVEIGGNPLRSGDVPSAIRAGIALVPEDRQHEGLVLPMAIGENLTLAVLRSLGSGPFLNDAREDAVARRFIGDLGIKTPGPELPVNALSGGNQQKVVLGKWLATEPRLLILDEPTKGVDVGAKAEVYRLIRNLAAQGLGVLLISSDLPEILQLADRILVMSEGRLRGELSGGTATQEAVLELALPDAQEVRRE